MEGILESSKRVFDRSTRAFGIAHVSLDEKGAPADVTIEYLNAAMAATAQSTPSEMQGKNIYEIWPDGDRAWLDFFYRAAYLGESVEFETVSVEYHTFQNVAIFPIREGYCGYEIQDVTAWLVHAHPVMENVSAGMLFYETRTGLLMLTDPAQECLGLDADDLSAREFADLLFEEPTATRVYESIADFSIDAERLLCEAQLRNGNWIRLSLSHAGPRARFVTGLVEDITRLKEAEAKSARRSEIIEGLSAEYYALYIIDLEADRLTPYLLRNEVAEYFARDVEANESYSAWLDLYCDRYVVDADKQKVLSQLSRQTLLARLKENDGDLSVVCKRLFGDDAQYVELRVIKVSVEAGELVLAARNINDEVKRRMDQNEALQSALSVARHANNAKTTFLTNISHDFRTPLNAIMGFTHLALEHFDEDERVRDSLEKIAVSSEHLLELINEILDVSRIESGKEVLNEQPLDLRHLLEEMRDVFAAQALESGIAFSVDATGIEHAEVVGDRLRITQILVNTIGNALKYTDRGGTVEVIVSEGPVSSSGLARFEAIVRDTGCGMSQDFIDRIFMPFERDETGNAQAAEGTGLGMTITKSLVDLIGGTITVKSQLGQGSEFDIVLPLRLDGDAGIGAEGAGDVGAEPRRFDGLRALIVDDDELSLEMLAVILADRGFEVDQASDGDEAIEAVSASDEGFYDVVIMDMRMPRMTGDVAAREIRKLPRRDVAELPIIAATADAFEEVHRRTREAGMTAYITKPIDTKELWAVLGRYARPGGQPEGAGEGCPASPRNRRRAPRCTHSRGRPSSSPR